MAAAQVELHADRLPKSWGNKTAAFSHFFSQMGRQQYRVANHEINFRKVDWYQQFKTVPLPEPRARDPPARFLRDRSAQRSGFRCTPGMTVQVHDVR